MISKLLPLLISAVTVFSSAARGQDRPNILWLVSEDNSPFIGAYGDTLAKTPTLDAMAERGVLYENAIANAPVCAPNRATIITGIYATSLGNHNMRSRADVQFPFFPSFLRKAGYYCTNNAKEDYNAETPEATWDESSGNAHYKNRGEGQPFFAIFNFGGTHESILHVEEVDTSTVAPADIVLPPYHPNTPTFRERWSHYYNQMRLLDAWVADHFRQLEEAGLADDTIVFYYSDHGGAMPRGKRFLFESGVRVPLIVYAPEKWRHLMANEPGSRSEEIVAAVDLAPTVLSLAGIRPQGHMQGRAFLGEYRQDPSGWSYTFRGRMDEVIDMQRGVRSDRYIYIRNYHSFQPNGTFLDYLWRNPAMQEWAELYKAGKLNEEQSRFFKPPPPEYLFDIRKDPHCVNNLAGDPEFRPVLKELRQANRKHILQVHDTGFIPEGMLNAASQGTTPYQFAHSDAYPLEKYLDVADAILDKGAVDALWTTRELLLDEDPVVQHWGLIACLTIGASANALLEQIQPLTRSETPEIRLLAMDYLAQFTSVDPRDLLKPILLGEGFDITRAQAATVLYNVREVYPLSRATLEAVKEGKYTRRVVNQYLKELPE